MHVARSMAIISAAVLTGGAAQAAPTLVEVFEVTGSGQEIKIGTISAYSSAESAAEFYGYDPDGQGGQPTIATLGSDSASMFVHYDTTTGGISFQFIMGMMGSDAESAGYVHAAFDGGAGDATPLVLDDVGDPFLYDFATDTIQSAYWFKGNTDGFVVGGLAGHWAVEEISLNQLPGYDLQSLFAASGDGAHLLLDMSKTYKLAAVVPIPPAAGLAVVGLAAGGLVLARLKT